MIQSGFWVIPKITPANLFKPIHDINYLTSISPIESGKCGISFVYTLVRKKYIAIISKHIKDFLKNTNLK